MCSIFNRANRVPANEDFTQSPHSRHPHVLALVAALKMHVATDRTEHTLTDKRIAKYRSVTHSLVMLPPDGSFACEQLAHLELLKDALLPCEQLTGSQSNNSSRPPKVLLCYAPEDRNMAEQICILFDQDGQLEGKTLEGPAWFDECGQLDPLHDVCVVLLSRHFVESYSCEGSFTFAADTGLRCVGVLIDKPGFQQRMWEQSDASLDLREERKWLLPEDQALLATLEAAVADSTGLDQSVAAKRSADLYKAVVSSLRRHAIRVPYYLRDILSDGIPKLPSGCEWHFFISKHEFLGKEVSQNLAYALEALGFSVWISQTQKDVDKLGMLDGIKKSMAVLLCMTTGVFQKERHWVTMELKAAIDASKPIIAFRPSKDGFDFDNKSDGHGGTLECPAECVLGVTKEFEPYARALVEATEVSGWASQQLDREAKIKHIVTKFLERDHVAQKLQETLIARLETVQPDATEDDVCAEEEV